MYTGKATTIAPCSPREGWREEEEDAKAKACHSGSRDRGQGVGEGAVGKRFLTITT